MDSQDPLFVLPVEEKMQIYCLNIRVFNHALTAIITIKIGVHNGF